jgi:hypothetical protein
VTASRQQRDCADKWIGAFRLAPPSAGEKRPGPDGSRPGCPRLPRIGRQPAGLGRSTSRSTSSVRPQTRTCGRNRHNLARGPSLTSGPITQRERACSRQVPCRLCAPRLAWGQDGRGAHIHELWMSAALHWIDRSWHWLQAGTGSSLGERGLGHGRSGLASSGRPVPQPCTAGLRQLRAAVSRASCLDSHFPQLPIDGSGQFRVVLARCGHWLPRYIRVLRVA